MPLNPKHNPWRRSRQCVRNTIQATIFEVFAGPEIGCELKAISQWLDRQRTLVSLMAGDLRRQGA